jgi:hypothetical protein
LTGISVFTIIRGLRFRGFGFTTQPDEISHGNIQVPDICGGQIFGKEEDSAVFGEFHTDIHDY